MIVLPQDLLDRTDNPDHEVIQANQDPPDLRAHGVYQDSPGHLAPPQREASRALQAPPASPDLAVNQDPKDQPVPQDRPDSAEHLVNLDHVETEERTVRQTKLVFWLDYLCGQFALCWIVCWSQIKVTRKRTNAQK